MILDWLNFFLVDVVGGCITTLSSIYIVPGVSVLSVIIVSVIAFILLICFIPKARS